jgi:deoxyinosine 3'endonuclease (endonuclease V)
VPKLSKNFSVKKSPQHPRLPIKKLVLQDRLPQVVRTVGGVDVFYFGIIGIGAVVVIDYYSFELLEAQTVACHIKMPHILTLLSFREKTPII